MCGLHGIIVACATPPPHLTNGQGLPQAARVLSASRVARKCARVLSPRGIHPNHLPFGKPLWAHSWAYQPNFIFSRSPSACERSATILLSFFDPALYCRRFPRNSEHLLLHIDC